MYEHLRYQFTTTPASCGFRVQTPASGGRKSGQGGAWHGQDTGDTLAAVVIHHLGAADRDIVTVGDGHGRKRAYNVYATVIIVNG
jgi:hypothetical protein